MTPVIETSLEDNYLEKYGFVNNNQPTDVIDNYTQQPINITKPDFISDVSDVNELEHYSDNKTYYELRGHVVELPEHGTTYQGSYVVSGIENRDKSEFDLYNKVPNEVNKYSFRDRIKYHEVYTYDYDKHCGMYPMWVHKNPKDDTHTGKALLLNEINNINVVDIDLVPMSTNDVSLRERRRIYNSTITAICQALPGAHIVKTGGNGLHIYTNDDGFMYNFINANSHNKSGRYVKLFEITIDNYHIFDVDLFCSGVDIDTRSQLMEPGTMVLDKSGSNRINEYTWIRSTGTSIKSNITPHSKHYDTIYRSRIIYSTFDVLYRLSQAHIIKLDDVCNALVDWNKGTQVVHESDIVSEADCDDDTKLVNIKYDEEFIEAVTDGLTGIEFHNYTSKSSKEEPTLLILFQGINSITIYDDEGNVDRVLSNRVIDTMYKNIKDYGNLTSNALTMFDKLRDDTKNKRFNNACVLTNLIKYHNKNYYNEHIKGLIQSRLVNADNISYNNNVNRRDTINIVAMDTNNPFRLETFISNVNKGKYMIYVDKDVEYEDEEGNIITETKTIKTIDTLRTIRDLSKFIRYVSTEDPYYLTKVYCPSLHSYSIKPTSRSQMEKTLRSIAIDTTTALKVLQDNLDLFMIDGIKFIKDEEDDISAHIYETFNGYTYDDHTTAVIDESNENVSHFINFTKEVICNNDDDLTKYILSWFAWIVQHPGKKTGIVPILRGSQGAGKNTFTNILSKILNKYSECNVSDINELTGTFNSVIVDKMLVVLNELSNYGDGRFANMDTLKSLITDSTIRVNEKNVPRRTMDNISNFIMVTNNIYPVKIERGDRRYVVLDTNGKYCGNREYWTNFNSRLTFEYYRDLTRYFMTVNIDDIDLVNPPMTEAKEDVINIHTSIEDKFIQTHYNELTSKDGCVVRVRDIKRYYQNKPTWSDNDILKDFGARLKASCTNVRRQRNNIRCRVYYLKPEKHNLYHYEPDYIDEDESEIVIE